MDDAGEKSSEIAKKIGNGFKVAAKATVAALTAISVAVTALTASAVKEYAEFEQLVGGVDTLFGDSSEKVKDFAAQAYKTAGLSANEYMNTVTSFSASLLQSLEGDTEAAADYANRALTDMSDNANKLGTDMSSIQNAYQGFAKQNYTMLDNLKLGYGGTKTEMQRLIKDAAALKDVQEELGVTVDANSTSFANIVNAIHVVQANMGILGTTAKEAATTVSGSINSMRAAWKNILVGIADDTADFDSLIDDFITTIVGENEGEGVINNLAPRVTAAFKGVAKLVQKLAPIIADILPDVIDEVTPSLLDAVFAVIDSIVGVFEDEESREKITNSAISLIEQLADGISTRLPQINKVAIELLKTFLKSLSEGDAAKEIAQGAVDCIIKLADELTKPDNIRELNTAAVDIVTDLISGIVTALTGNPDQVEDILSNLMWALSVAPIELGLSSVIQIASNIISAIADGIGNTDNPEDILYALFDALISSPFNMFKDIGIKIALEIVRGLREAFPNNAALKSIESTLESMLDEKINTEDAAKNAAQDAKPPEEEEEPEEEPKEKKNQGKQKANTVKGLNQSSKQFDETVSDMESDIQKVEGFTPLSGGTSGGSNVTVNQYIYSEAKTASELMQEAIYEQEKAVIYGV